MNKTSVPAWAKERAMCSFSGLESSTTALLVVDLQNYFMVPGQARANPNTEAIVPNVNRIADQLRARGGHVAWCRHTMVDEGPGRLPEWLAHRETGSYAEARSALTPGNFGHELHKSLHVDTVDLVFDKYRYSAFVNAGLDLDAHLKSKNIDTVIVTGTVTGICCESTARDALMRDYRVFFITDATSAATDDEHNAALVNLQIAIATLCTTAEVLSLIES